MDGNEVKDILQIPFNTKMLLASSTRETMDRKKHLFDTELREFIDEVNQTQTREALHQNFSNNF